MAKLIVFHRDQTKTEHELGDGERVTVGRKMNNTIVLKDPHVSRRHFYIECADDTFTMVNLSKTHGTRVNGKKTEKTVLKDEDIVQAGGARLVFSLAPEEDDEAEDSTYMPVEAAVGETVFFDPEGEKVDENLLATCDPSKLTIHAAFETAVSQNATAELRRRFILLQDIGNQMVTQLQLDTLLEFVLDKIFELFRPDNGLILLSDPDTNELVPMCVRLMGKQAREANQMRLSKTLVQQVCVERIGVLCADTAADDRFSAQESIMAFGMRSIMAVPLLHQGEVLGMIHVDSESIQKTFNQQDLDLLTMLGNQAALYVHNAKQHDKIVRQETLRANYERYFSPQVAEQIATNQIQLEPGGTSADVTILFSDIRGFTPLSERVGPEETLAFLNKYFTEMAECVFEFSGTFDKFIGDALMAVFGSPIKDPDACVNAARSAEKMIRRLMEMEFDVGPVTIGIGLHTGRVIHGNIGSEKVMQYTVIGDVVNTTSRLCDVAKPNQILLSPDMKEALGKRADCRPVGVMELKGISKPVETFELVRCI